MWYNEGNFSFIKLIKCIKNINIGLA